jgi:hypothetical protein
MELADVLDQYGPRDLRVYSSHDGIRVYRITGETNQWGEPEDELVWSWDPAHDRAPISEMRLLFEELDFDVEQL